MSEDQGGSKIRVLDEYRLARDENEVRLPPFRDRLAALKMEGPLPVLIVQAIEQMRPDLMKLFYPRIYENIGAYHSPKVCAAYLANVVAETERYGFHRSPAAYRAMMPALPYLIQHKTPLLFIAPELLEAIQRTDFADDISWVDMKLPYEHGVFVLPKGALVHPEDGEVCMIIWSRNFKGSYPMPFAGVPEIQIMNDAMVISGLCADNAIWYDSTVGADVRQTIRLRNLFYRKEGERYPSRQKNSPLDSDLEEKDEDFLEKMGVVAFGTLLALNARPELLETGKLLRKVSGKGDKPPREFWSPNVIGLKYKAKRAVAKIVDLQFVTPSREKGSHASPRMHWRRGHFRSQPVGQGRRERKVIWLEPMLIG